MRHLYNFSVCQSLETIPGIGEIKDRLSVLNCDGFELFTLFEKIPEEYIPFSPSVHLPFAIDWYRSWCENIHSKDIDEDNLKYVFFGRNRGEIINNVVHAIECAAEVNPDYGVLHGGNTNIMDIMSKESKDDDKKVIEAFVEMVNSVASRFPKGEPPFKLAFENLWRSGLKLRGPEEYHFLCKKLEFDNWGLCVDTGHLMNTLPHTNSEEEAIDDLLKIFDSYPQDMKDRIGTVHFHMSLSADYRNTYNESIDYESMTIMEIIQCTYPHIMKIDQHLPFSNPRCTELIEKLNPEYVTHEFISYKSGDSIEDYILQRSHFCPLTDESYI